jgi:hypothetical protein
MLERFADQISQSQVKRHAFFLGVTLASILIIGYQFGTYDQTVHIPFLKAMADPALFPGDAFVALRQIHYSYFWYLFLPFYNWGVLEPTLFITHVMITYFTFWMVYELCETLFKSPLSSMFGTLAFVLPHLSFCGFTLIEYSLLNRTFALPFLILAINLYLRGIRARSFFMLGMLYNLHVLSVNYVLALFFFDFLLEYRKIGWKKILNCIVVFILAALPVLLWKMQGASGTEISLEPVWFDLITRSMMLHIFYLAGNFYGLFTGLSALSAYVLFLYARRFAPPRPHDQTVTIFVLATALVVLVEGIVAGWLPLRLLIQFQIMRAGLFGVMFGYLYFADYLARKWATDGMRKPGDATLIGTFLLSPLIFVPLLALVTQRWWSSTTARLKATSVILSVAFVTSLAAAAYFNTWHPGIEIYGPENPWREVQEWAKANTSKEAIFITPLNQWWIYEADWRVFSERQTVTTLSEILEACFEPGYMSIWQPRFETLAPGAIDKFNGNFIENRQITAQAYNNLSTEALLSAACQYQVSYIVTEKAYPRGLPQVYENMDYLVYDVRQVPCK